MTLKLGSLRKSGESGTRLRGAYIRFHELKISPALYKTYNCLVVILLNKYCRHVPKINDRPTNGQVPRMHLNKIKEERDKFLKCGNININIV